MTYYEAKRLRALTAHIAAFASFTLLLLVGLATLWHAMDWSEPSMLVTVALSAGLVVAADAAATLAFPLP